MAVFADYGTRTVSEIAQDLGLSVKTISTYLSRISDKLRIDSRADLKVMAKKFAEARPQ